MSLAFAYARVSTEEQDLETQVRVVEDWARTNNVIILRWFVDHGISGATPLQERPGFRQLIQELNNANPRPRLLLVYDVTRVARSLREFFHAWSFIEDKLDLVLVPVRNLDLFRIQMEYREVLKTLLGLFAELEREFIRQRTRDAMRRLRAQGKLTSIVDKLRREHPDLLDAICREYESGEPKYRLAKKYNLSMYTVDRIIREYCGHNPSLSCPRCMHLLIIEKKSPELVEGKLIVRYRYYCKHCGFILEKIEQLTG